MFIMTVTSICFGKSLKLLKGQLFRIWIYVWQRITRRHNTLIEEEKLPIEWLTAGMETSIKWKKIWLNTLNNRCLTTKKYFHRKKVYNEKLTRSFYFETESFLYALWRRNLFWDHTKWSVWRTEGRRLQHSLSGAYLCPHWLKWLNICDWPECSALLSNNFTLT